MPGAPPFNRAAILSQFEALLRSRNGSVPYDDFTHFATDTSLVRNRADLSELMKLVDTNRDGTVSMEEFQHLLYILERSNLSNPAEVMFFASDLDHSGKIGARELLVLLHKLGFAISMHKARNLVARRIDDPDGEICYEDFKSVMDELLTHFQI